MKIRVSWHSVTFKAETNKKNPPTSAEASAGGITIMVTLSYYFEKVVRTYSLEARPTYKMCASAK